MSPEVVAIVGRSGVGKTHLIEGLLAVLFSQGLRVATIKHTHHEVFSDKPGSDTDRHRRAGAQLTALAGPRFCTVFVDEEIAFERVVNAVGCGMDLVLVEGYKAQPTRKIEVVRGEKPILAARDRWMTVTSDQVSDVAQAIFALIQSREDP